MKECFSFFIILPHLNPVTNMLYAILFVQRVNIDFYYDEISIVGNKLDDYQDLIQFILKLFQR